MALAISVGFVVDDAIVMIENMYRNLEHGMGPFQAALEGAKQIGFTVLSISLSLIAAFTPLIFMDGIVGRLLREFSLTLAFAIIVSTLVSLTITPMICAHYIKSTISTDATWFDRLVEGLLSRVVRFYERTLHVVLRFPILTVLVFFATIGLTVMLYAKVPKGYFPTDDSGFIFGSTRASPDISFQSMLKLQEQVADIVMADPAVQGIGSILGGSGGPGGGSSNRGTIFISLKSVEERGDLSTAMVIDRLRRELGKIPGIRLFMVAAQDIRAGGRQSDSDFQYTLISTDLDLLQKWGPIIAKRMETVEGITDISSDSDPGGLQLNLSIDRDTAASLGVSVQSIDNALNNAFSRSGRFRSSTPSAISTRWCWRPIRSSRTIRPTSIASMSPAPITSRCRFRRWCTTAAGWPRWRCATRPSFPSTTVSFNLLPDVPLETATANIQRAVGELHMPEGIRGSFDGNAGDSQKTAGRQPLLILGALIAVYIVLGVLYESLAHPLTIISTLPPAGLGALLALVVTNTQLTVIAFIGIILLIRHRQEERHHDRRLRAGRRTPSRTVVDRRDFRGLHRALSPDHHDHDGGAAGSRAAGGGDRAGDGVAPATRHHHHRRPDRFADPDAVHDAGDLSPDRPDAAAIRPRRRRSRAGRIGRQVAAGRRAAYSGLMSDQPQTVATATPDEIPDCPRCGKPMPLCVCDSVTPVKSRMSLVILQHPQEQDRLLGTARLTALHFEKAVLKIGLSWPSLSKILGRTVDPARWAVLYLGSSKVADLDTDQDIVRARPQGPARRPPARHPAGDRGRGAAGRHLEPGQGFVVAQCLDAEVSTGDSRAVTAIALRQAASRAPP